MDPIPEGLINAVHTGTYGHEARVEFEKDRVQKFITKRACDILICTEPNLEIFEFHKKEIPNGTRILVTDQTMEFYSEKLDNREEHLLDHVIAYSPDGYLTKLEVVTTLKKLLTNDSYYQQIKNKLTDEVNIKKFYDIEENVRNLEMLLKSVSMN